MTRIGTTADAIATTAANDAGDAPKYAACSLQGSSLAKEGQAPIQNQARSSLKAPI